MPNTYVVIFCLKNIVNLIFLPLICMPFFGIELVKNIKPCFSDINFKIFNSQEEIDLFLNSLLKKKRPIFTLLKGQILSFSQVHFF